MSEKYIRADETRKVPNVTIRAATESDERTIKQMVRTEHLDPTSLRWQHFLVAEHEGNIVGIGQLRDYPGCQELGSLVVLPEYRGSGIAGQLIRALEARAGRPLYLFCRDRMESYYGRFGYKRIGYWSAPPALRLKMLLPMTFRIFGIRIILMRKA